MEDPSIEDHKGWTRDFWLILALISNAHGANLAFHRVSTFPYSWFLTVFYISIYRVVFAKGRMPIIIDLGFTLFLEGVYSFGDFGWKLACSIPILSMVIIIVSVYVGPLFKEYMRLKELNPDSMPSLEEFIHPLSKCSFMCAFWQTLLLNGIFLVFAWFYPSHKQLYNYFQNIIGIALVIESIFFLSCYKEVKENRDKPTLQGPDGNTGISGRKARRERKKLKERSA